MSFLDLTVPEDLAKAREQELLAGRLRAEVQKQLKDEARGPIITPEMLTLRERLARPRTETVWRIKGWQGVQHRVVFAAQYKAGKTTLVLNLIRSLLDGSPFLDEYEVFPIEGTVALLDFEMSENQLDDWYRDQNIQADDRLWVVPMRGHAESFNLSDPAVRTKWADMLRARGVRYIVIDCLTPILDSLGLDVNKDAGVFLVALDGLQKEADIPEAVVVHHMGHANERSLGSVRLRGWPDVEWMLTRESEDPTSERSIKAYGRDVDVPKTKLVWNPTTRRLAVGGVFRDVKVASAVQAVAVFVGHAEKPPTRRQIEAGLKEDGEHSQRDVRRAIREAVQLGRIRVEKGKGRNGGSAYRLVEEGSAM